MRPIPFSVSLLDGGFVIGLEQSERNNGALEIDAGVTSYDADGDG